MTGDGWYWLSSKRLTVAVRVQEGLIAEGPPIVRKFVGRPASSLARWMRRQGDLRSGTLDMILQRKDSDDPVS